MEKKPPRLDIYPTAELVLALDRWRIEQPGAPSRAEVVRAVLEEFLRDKGIMERSGSPERPSS